MSHAGITRTDTCVAAASTAAAAPHAAPARPAWSRSAEPAGALDGPGAARSRAGRRRRRAGRRATLCRPRPLRHVTNAEPAVVSDQALSRSSAHRPRISPDPERARAGFAPRPCRANASGSEGQNAAGVLLVEHHVPTGVLQCRLIPVAAAVAELPETHVHRRLALDEPGGRVIGAARLVDVVALRRK